MRDVPPEILDALSGTNAGVSLDCSAIYDGAVVEGSLDVSAWTLSWRLDAQQVIQGSADFTIQDRTGSLAPWGFDEPLSVGGSRIQAAFRCAGESVPMGEWLVTQNQPNETWRLARHGSESTVRWVTGGATVPVAAADLTQLLSDDRFLAPEAPPQSGATVFSEIERLCAGIIGVEFVGVTDRPVAKTMVYSEERINAVADLVHMVGEYRVNGDGLLQVFNPERPAVPHWEIVPGEEGSLVTVGREQSRDILFNAVAASSQTEDGKELRAYATTGQGPLRFDGPFGRKPTTMTGTAANVNDLRMEAEAYLRTQVESSNTVLNVYCTPSPLYEIGDWGTIVQPVIDGTVYPLVGRCVGVELSGGSEGVAAMKLTMECATSDVLAVARYVRGADS